VRARDEFLAAIDREQALIARLGREREEALARVRSLQAQLGTPGEDVDCSVSPAPPSTAGEKVVLFRSLFRGRDDVFPKLWVNPRTDRKGYAPACSNDWVRGVCEKPRVKCSECPNQAFISVSDQVVLDHGQGRHDNLRDEHSGKVTFVERLRKAGLLPVRSPDDSHASATLKDHAR
jgi:hypothetical protein